MTETRIKISSIVENQLPQFVLEEFPLVSEFLSQYYISLESQGNVSDILQNIDQYIKVDQLTNLVESTVLTSDVTFFDSTINVSSTAGFPNSYGLLLIDSEIITYTSKTPTTFEGCIRGFSGVTSYKIKDELTFTETESQEHIASATVTNLSILFLKEFLIKVKKQVTPGFEERELYSELNENLFIKQSIDFYSSKGTDNSFKILFGALYGQEVEVIKPRDYLIQPSDAQYRITSDLVVEEIEGNLENLVNTTIYQKNSDDEIIAQGTVSKVEKIRRGSKNYYTLSLDSAYNNDIGANGTVYGNEISFTTTGVIPSLTTTAASSTTISSFTTGGTISNDGGNLVTYRGICWSTSSNPTINDNRILSGTGTGTFTITLSNLNLATTYYVRSFATNSAGTAYGNERAINTSSLAVGTTYQGGKIAYIFQSGDLGYVAGEIHGFIIMEHKMGMTSVFGSDGTYYSDGGTTMAFGYGLQNTRSLAGKSWNNFAKYIYNVSFHGYNDWYVPSYYEWNKIGPNWRYLGIPNGYFHASSESSSNSYYFYSYENYGYLYTGVGNGSKTSVYDIIGIRNF